MSKGPEFSPRQISPAYVDHVLEERTKRVPVVQNPKLEKQCRDWCPERLHVDKLGGKSSSLGWVMFGGGTRRTIMNDNGSRVPFLYLQQVLSENEGKVQVVLGAHRFCVGLFALMGAVTLDEQDKLIEVARLSWEGAVKRMVHYSPADAQRIDFRVEIGCRGSAPLIEFDPGGRIRVVNPDYLKYDICQYPLGLEATDRLVLEQREQLVRRGVIFQG